MDPLTQILLTVGLNALVTGVFVYLFQKRLDDRYAKRQFEDQVKFSRVYPKTLEVIEGFHQKLHEYISKFNLYSVHVRAMARGDSSLTEREFAQLEEEPFIIVTELGKYLDVNRIYLPISSDSEVTSVFRKLQDLDFIMSYARIISTQKRGFQGIVDLINTATKTVGMDLREISPHSKGAMDLFITKVDSELERLVLRLDSHYKTLTSKPS
jgi:hypothetical protein